jgi:hypothetical protein
MVALLSPGTADTAVGAAGVVTGTNMFEGFDGTLVPIGFVAVTRQVYVLPLVNDETTIGLAVPNADAPAPPFSDAHATVKLEIPRPPSPFERNVTDAEPGPRVAVPIVGAGGTEAANAGFAGAANTNEAASTDSDTSVAFTRCLIAPPRKSAELAAEAQTVTAGAIGGRETVGVQLSRGRR